MKRKNDNEGGKGKVDKDSTKVPKTGDDSITTKRNLDLLIRKPKRMSSPEIPSKNWLKTPTLLEETISSMKQSQLLRS